jgi:ABC-type transport system involved in multi-copper enzyme maturation permease subunit
VIMGLICWAKLFVGHPLNGIWRLFFTGSSLYSLTLSQVAVALIGGNAIAGERVDRSAEFLFSLPVTRRRLLASKLLMAVLIIAVPWVFNSPILGCLVGTLPVREFPAGLGSLLTFIAVTGLTFFCVAWFLSSVLASPTFAVCGGLVTPWIIGSGFLVVCGLLGVRLNEEHFEEHFEDWYRISCLTISPPLFALGTWLYLRRVEP